MVPEDCWVYPPALMQKERRLRKPREFSRVMQEGRSWVTPLLVLRGVPNGLEQTRFGFAAGQRVGVAVVRNRVKRRLREVARTAPVKEGWDLVFIARNGAVTAGYQELARSVEILLQRARLLRSHPSEDVVERS